MKTGSPENIMNDEQPTATGMTYDYAAELAERLRSIPAKPGVYQYLNDKGKVIYVGKAVSLRSRVKSYFQNRGPVDAKTKALVKNIHDIEIIVTDTEPET